MNSWESFFREKSLRRFRNLSREKTIKAGILFVLFASIAAAIFMSAAGLPR